MKYINRTKTRISEQQNCAQVHKHASLEHCKVWLFRLTQQTGNLLWHHPLPPHMNTCSRYRRHMFSLCFVVHFFKSAVVNKLRDHVDQV